jgi:hypothetical protein
LRKPKNKVIKISRSDNTIGAAYWLIACLKKRQNPRTKVVEGTTLWEISKKKKKKQNKQTTFLCR